MNMCPSQVSPPRTPGSNEYVPLAGVPSKNTRAFTCSYQFNPLKLILTPSDIQHSAATQIWGCYRLVSEPSIQSSASARYLTLPSIQIQSQQSLPWELMMRESDGGNPGVILCSQREEQPLPLVDSPTAESPGYVAESDPEEDPEEYEDDETEDDETEDGPVNYPMDGGDDEDDDDGDSSMDDTDDTDEDEEEEEEHLAPPNSAVFRSALLRIASTQALIDAVTDALPSPPLPPLPPSLYIPPPVEPLGDIVSESDCHLNRKRLCLSTLGSRYEIGESSTARPIRGRGIDYEFVSTVDAEARRQGIIVRLGMVLGILG
ncbi:hypothetical protein Tco_0754967 [Tanacetum coccineum]